MHAGGWARGGARWVVHVLTWPARIVLFEGEAVHAGGRARGGARWAVHAVLALLTAALYTVQQTTTWAKY